MFLVGWCNVVFLVQLLLCFSCSMWGVVSCSIIVGVMWCFLFNYCWRNVVFLVQLLLG